MSGVEVGVIINDSFGRAWRNGVTGVAIGVAGMTAATFAAFNIAGGVLWGGGVTLLGFALGKRYEWMGDKIDVLAPVIVAISLLPILVEYLRHRRHAKAQ